MNIKDSTTMDGSSTNKGSGIIVDNIFRPAKAFFSRAAKADARAITGKSTKTLGKTIRAEPSLG